MAASNRSRATIEGCVTDPGAKFICHTTCLHSLHSGWHSHQIKSIFFGKLVIVFYHVPQGKHLRTFEIVHMTICSF